MIDDLDNGQTVMVEGGMLMSMFRTSRELESVKSELEKDISEGVFPPTGTVAFKGYKGRADKFKEATLEIQNLDSIEYPEGVFMSSLLQNKPLMELGGLVEEKLDLTLQQFECEVNGIASDIKDLVGVNKPTFFGKLSSMLIDIAAGSINNKVDGMFYALSRGQIK